MIYLLVFILMSFVANTNAQCTKDQDCYEVWGSENGEEYVKQFNEGRLANDTCNTKYNPFSEWGYYAHDWDIVFEFNVFKDSGKQGDTLTMDDIKPEYSDLKKFFKKVEEEQGKFIFVNSNFNPIYNEYEIITECYSDLFYDWKDDVWFKYILEIDYKYGPDWVLAGIKDTDINISINGSKVIYDPLGIKEIYLVNILGERIEIKDEIGEIDFTELNDGMYILKLNSNIYKLIKTGGSDAKIYRSIHRYE